MFETHEEALVTSEFYSEEVLLEWRFVSQRFNSEWFYICQHFFQKGSEEVAKRMLLIDDINEFKALIKALDFSLESCILTKQSYYTVEYHVFRHIYTN